MPAFRSLLELLKNGQSPSSRLFIQPHDFPDPDAIASAFGLQQLLLRFGIRSAIVYEGDLERAALVSMINQLSIRIATAGEVLIRPTDRVIIVDGCLGTKNVTNLQAREIAVIDHHEVAAPDHVDFVDIRPDLGACSSRIFEYWEETGQNLDSAVATALVIGLSVDTAILTRGATEADIRAFYRLSGIADMPMAHGILRRNLEAKDLCTFRYAIDHAVMDDGFTFCHIPEGCDQNLLGILADFFISVKEIRLVVLSADNTGKVNVSVRSGNPEWNAASLLGDALRGIGYGGGHSDMAGGVVPLAADYQPEDFRQRILRLLQLN